MVVKNKKGSDSVEFIRALCRALETKFNRLLVNYFSVFILGLGIVNPSFADVIATKQAFDASTGDSITNVELGQTIEYAFNWNCSFTGAPPAGECGDFQINDPLPEGVTFVSCSVPGLYSCLYNPAMGSNGVVTIEAADPARNLLSGESATASIVVKLSTDIADFQGMVPGPLNNNATADSADGSETISANLTINAPTNNWEISKSVAIPAVPIQPALDSNVVYRIEACPQGPAGLGTGTVIIENPSITDICPAGATVVGATLNGVPVIPTGACPSVDIPMPATFSPADGCQEIKLTLQYPSASFTVGTMVTNGVQLDGDNIGAATCPNNCDDEVTSTLSTPNPDANISKTAKRNEVGPGAFNRYSINFDTRSSNVVLDNVVIEDIFPVDIDPSRIRHRRNWSDENVTARIIELPTMTVLEAAYDGTTNFDRPLAANATGFRVEFNTPVPPGFNGGRFELDFRLDSALVAGDTTRNCVTVTTPSIPGGPRRACRDVDVINPTSDLNITKDMPARVGPGSTFTTRFQFVHDDTSSVGAVNPVIADCVPNELEFVSWDNIVYSGLDDPRARLNTTNSLPLAVEPNLEVLAPGAAGNTCADATRTMVRWSWQTTAPAGSVRLDGTPGVNNPFTFPIRRDNSPRDNVGDASGDLGLYVRIRLDTTFRVKAGVLQQNGLSNVLEAMPQNPDFRCTNSLKRINPDNNDIDGDGITGVADPLCTRTENYNVLSSAAFGGNKFIQSFPGLPNFDPLNSPVDNTAAASTGIVTPANCPSDDSGRTRAPCVAQAMKDQPFNYRIRLSNDGNVLLTDYIVYDILPNTDTAGSDTGISESQVGVVRGSSWVAILNGPVMVSSTNPTVAAELAANAVIEYSASTNPCRPELSIADDTRGGDWQAGACVDDWTTIPLADSTTFPNGYASVRAWRMNVPFAAGWPIADPNDSDQEDIIVDLEMRADATAPPSDYEALPNPSLQIAWNNIAHRATDLSTGRRLLASEAFKSGIVMPAEYPLMSTGLRVGNLVWFDNNNDGIAQDNEQGIFDVTVQLWNDITGNGPSADDTLYDTTQTEAEGHYLFDDADLTNRDGLGIPAGDYYVVIPRAQTGSFILGENFSSTNDEPNPDTNIDNDDNGAFDSDDLITPLPVGFDGIYSGTINLTLDTEPTNETRRKNDLADDDDDFFDDDDSNISVDFGFYQLRLGNHVWLDSNNDGNADSNEPAIEGLQVQLFIDNGDGNFDPDTDMPSAAVTTDSNGQYVFDGLDAGNYFVVIPAGQAGLTAGSTTYSTDQLASSTFTSMPASALGNDNNDDGDAGTFGSTTPVHYASVSPLYALTVGAAQTGESDTSQNGENGSSATNNDDANAELGANLDANFAFSDSNSFLTADFGLTPAVSLGSTIWIDADADGIQEPGENPIPGATITLLDSLGTAINDAAGMVVQTTTNADGEYNFNGLPPGTYRVSVDISTSSVLYIEGYVPSPNQQSNADNNSNLDSNIDFVNDPNATDLTFISAQITLSSGAEPTSEQDPIDADIAVSATNPDSPNQIGLADNSGNMTLDMGFVAAVSLGSTLWIDDNENGSQDVSETPIVGATVTLLNADGTSYDGNLYVAGVNSLTAITNTNGEYNFNGLPPGDYRVKVDLSTAINSNASVLIPTPIQVPDPDAVGADRDSNTDSNIDLSVAGSAVGVNAGDSFLDKVFTSGIVTLLAGTEPTGELDSVGSGGVNAADQPNQGAMPADDPDDSGNMTVDFGFIEPVSVGSKLWFDSNGDGLQTALEPAIVGATVTLLNADGTAFDSDPTNAALDALTAVTNAQGGYNFNDLPEGDYRVEVDLSTVTSHVGTTLRPTPIQVPDPDAAGPSQDSNTDSNVDITAPGHNPTANIYQTGVFTLAVGSEPLATVETDAIGVATLVADQPNQTLAQPDANGNMTIDMGFYTPLSIGSYVWNDLDGDGIQDDVETPIAGAQATLYRETTPGTFVKVIADQNGNVFGAGGSITTGADGLYLFANLAPENYKVRVEPPLGFAPTEIQDGADNADTMVGDELDSNIDLGAVGVPAGSFDSGVFTLISGGEPSEINAAEGDTQDGMTGSPGDLSGNMTIDFGFVRPLSIGSIVFNDDNGDNHPDANDANGIQNEGEPGINGATVTLLVTMDDGMTLTPVRVDANGVYDLNQVGATVADASVTTSALINGVTVPDGSYNFSGLPRGDYVVRVVPNGGFSPTNNQNALLNDGVNLDSNLDLTATTPSGSWQSSVIKARYDQAPVSPAEDDPAGVIEVDPSGTADLASDLTIDFGFVERVSFGSTLWFDLDRDGSQDAGEDVLRGATITLLNANGSEYDADSTTPGIQGVQTTTNANGEYNFNDLLAGSYRVGVKLTTVTNYDGARLRPSPTQVVDPNNNSNSDSNIDTSAAGQDITNSVYQSGVIVLGISQEPTLESDPLGGAGGVDQPGQGVNDLDENGNMTLDMGFVPTGRIGDLILADIDGDGVLDAGDGDVGLGGVTVSIQPPIGVDLGNGIDQPLTTVTATDGTYLFEGLPPGSGYVVTVDTATLPSTLGTDIKVSYDPDGGTDNTSTTDLNLDGNGEVIDDLDQDFGYVPLGSIGDTIWYDANADGIQDIGELGIPGVTVQLTLPGGATQTQVTDANGNYLFSILPPGNYQVDVVAGLLPEYRQTGDPDMRLDGRSTVTLSLSNTGPGGTPQVIENLDQDFGYVEPVSIGSFIWNDLDGDGQQDANEPPIAGASVSLLVRNGIGGFGPAQDQQGTLVPVLVSAVNGTYKFDNLPSGDYKVVVTPTPGYIPSPVQTSANGDRSQTDSNIAGPGRTANSYESGVFTLLGGNEPVEASTVKGDNQDVGGLPSVARDESGNMSVDFAFVESASIGNHVWLDLDRDGVQDANEDGIANVKVILLADTNGNGILDGLELTTPVATHVTGSNGEYLFPNLVPGLLYATMVDDTSLPTSLEQTYDEGPSRITGTLDHTSDPIDLSPGEEHLTADFGYAPSSILGVIGDTVWADAIDNGVQDPGEPGIQGVTVTLTPAPTVDAGNGPGAPVSVVTDENGKYLFTDLPLDQNYIVSVDLRTLPSGYMPSVSGLGDPDVRDGFSTPAEQDSSTIVSLTNDSNIMLDADFGYLPDTTQNNIIGDTVWRDINEDGVIDADEPRIAGVTLTLYDNLGNAVATTITNFDGMYLFSGIPDGTYRIVVTDQNNVLDGMDQTFDGDDPAAPGVYTPITPSESMLIDLGVGINIPDTDLNQDFGYVDRLIGLGDGIIGDAVFFDENGSGTFDSGEGLEGVTVQLFGPGSDGIIGNSDDELLGVQTTNENGYYLFTGLDINDSGPNPGTDYRVEVDVSSLPNSGAGWTNSIDPDSPAGSGNHSSVTTLSVGNTTDLDQDFGYISDDNNSISGTIWPDTDGDGQLTESGRYEGVTLELKDLDGNVIGRAETDSSGGFMFNNLPDGQYMVVVTDDHNILNGFEHTDSPNGTSDKSDSTSKDDTGYIVDLDSAGAIPTPVMDTTADFGYMPTITNPITLGSFIARAVDVGVEVKWQTQTEIANIGFNIYAKLNGEWRQLNPEVVIGQGDSIKVQDYSAIFNVNAKVFALSDIDMSGKETLHGPFILGQTYGLMGERRVIDWQAEYAERERKRLKRQAAKKAQQAVRQQKFSNVIKGGE